jgi:hypothetical protein
MTDHAHSQAGHRIYPWFGPCNRADRPVPPLEQERASSFDGGTASAPRCAADDLTAEL